MSAPIAIRRAVSPAGSVHIGSPSTSPSSAAYIPLHRRTPSEASSSRPSSPISDKLASPRHYSPSALLALCPPPTIVSTSPDIVNIQERIRAACPEVLLTNLTSRARKSAAFNRRRTQTDTANAARRATLKTAPSKPETTAPASIATRVPSRRMRPAGRGPERRRAALFSDNWRMPRTISAPQPQAV